MNLTSESVINLKNENLNIQSINIIYLEFNINNVINTLILKNAFYTSLIMYNIMTTEPLRVKNFSVAIQKNNSALYESDEMKFTILNAKYQFIMF